MCQTGVVRNLYRYCYKNALATVVVLSINTMHAVSVFYAITRRLPKFDACCGDAKAADRNTCTSVSCSLTLMDRKENGARVYNAVETPQCRTQRAY